MSCIFLSFVAVIRFLNILDERYAKSSRSKADVFVRKTRKIGVPSSSVPPPDAPEWTLAPEWTAANTQNE